MTVYYILYLNTLILSFFSLDKKAFPPVLFVGINLFIFLFIVGLRYDSTDYMQYMFIYDAINSLEQVSILFAQLENDWKTTETGFALLILFEKYTTSSFYIFIFVFALISLSIKFYSFYKMSPYFMLSLLLYLSDVYFWKDMGQMRNAMASAIVLFSVFYLVKKENFKFIITIFIAGMIHNFAFLGFFLYLFKYFNSKKTMITIFVFSILIAFIGGAGKLIVLLTELLDLGSDTRLLLYLSGRDSQAFALFGGTFLVHLVLSFFLLMKYNSLTNYSEYNKILVPMYIYGTVLIFMFIDIGIISSRIRDLFTVPSSIILIPMLLKIIDGRYKKLVFFAIIVYSMIFFTLMIKNNIDMPYKNLIMM